MKGTAALADKVRGRIDEARNTLENAMFSLELMRPLVKDAGIIDPLHQTFAANSLSALTWRLYSEAALDAVKATLDSDARSASLAAAMALLDRPDVVAAVRKQRTAPVKVHTDYGGIVSPAEQRRLDAAFMKERQLDAAKEFDDGLARARDLYVKLLDDPAITRLKKARDKIMAHTDTVLSGGVYRRRTPEDLGLKWGDPDTVVTSASVIVKVMLGALFGYGIDSEDAREIFADYSDDFWRHLRKGLETGGGPDKPVRARRRSTERD